MSGSVGFYGVLLRATDSSGRSTDRTLSIRILSATTSPAQPAGSDDSSAWRPAATRGLRSPLYSDGQGRGSEERRGGTEFFSTRRSLWSPYPYEIKKKLSTL